MLLEKCSETSSTPSRRTSTHNFSNGWSFVDWTFISGAIDPKVSISVLLYDPWFWTWMWLCLKKSHYKDVIMGVIASQITSLTVVYSTVYSGADLRQHRCSASVTFVRGIHRWPVNSSHKWPVTRKMFPFDDAIMVVKNPITDFRTVCSHWNIINFPEDVDTKQYLASHIRYLLSYQSLFNVLSLLCHSVCVQYQMIPDCILTRPL